MAFNDSITRSTPGGGALVPPEHANKIFKEAEQSSAALSLMNKVKILTNQKTFPVLNSKAHAFWMDYTANPQSDTAKIQTTSATWKNITMNVADIGVIIPIPRRLAEDIKASGINITDEVRPMIAEAIGRQIDQSIFFGVNKPVVWPDAVAVAAAAAGNVRTQTATATQGSLHSDIIQLLRLIRADGYTANAGIGRGTFEFDLLDARDSTGQPLFQPALPGVLGSRASLLGRSVQFATDGVFPAEDIDASNINLVMFDPTKHLIGIREEIEIKVFDTGSISDGTGTEVFNLLTQDMQAIRAIARIGFAVAKPVTNAQPNEASRYPGGVLQTVDPTP